MAHRVAGDLPEEMIVEILVRMPARDVWGVRRVCKRWDGVIIHPQFALKHFDRNKNNILLIAFSDQLIRKSLSLFRLSHPPRTLVDIDCMSPRKLDFFRKLNFPDCFKELFVAGSYNGILCVSSFYTSISRFLALWNPAINHWKQIPLLPPKYNTDTIFSSVGLAFDSLTNDYRIIRLVGVESSNLSPCSRIEMYSANHNSWLDLASSSIPYFTTQPNCNVIIKGVPYWSRTCNPFADPSCKPVQTNVIATVDPHTGLYQGIDYPQIVTHQDTTVHPFSFMDSLAVLIYSPGDRKMFHVYTLDDKSPGTDWINLYSSAPTTILQNTNMCIFRCFQDADKIIVVGWNHYQGCSFLYDLQADCLCHSTGIDTFRPQWDETYHHVESLICLDGMEPIQTEDGRYIYP